MGSLASFCEGNVSNCKGKKLEYDPPLHKPPTYKKQVNGKWKTYRAKNSKGVPLMHPSPQQMARDVYNHIDKIDQCSAAKNIAVETFQDMVIGKTSQPAQSAFMKNVRRAGQIGFASGPAL
jgi:hypothetical protein